METQTRDPRESLRSRLMREQKQSAEAPEQSFSVHANPLLVVREESPAQARARVNRSSAEKGATATDSALQRRSLQGTQSNQATGGIAGWKPSPLVNFFVALFAVSLFYVWCQTQVVRATYGISELKKKERALISQNERLRLEISTLSAPAALGKKAQEQLALVPPQPGQIVMVK